MGKIQVILRHIHFQFIWPAEKALLRSHNPPLREEIQCTDVYIRLHSASRQLAPAAGTGQREKGYWVSCQGKTMPVCGYQIYARDFYLEALSWFNHLLSPSWKCSHPECSCVFMSLMCTSAWGCMCSSAWKTNGFLFSESSRQLTRTWGSLIGWAAWPSASASPGLREAYRLLCLLLFLFYMNPADLHPVPPVTRKHFPRRTISPVQFCSLKEKSKGLRHIHADFPFVALLGVRQQPQALLFPCLIIMINDCNLTLSRYFGTTKDENSDEKLAYVRTCSHIPVFTPEHATSPCSHRHMPHPHAHTST